MSKQIALMQSIGQQGPLIGIGINNQAAGVIRLMMSQDGLWRFYAHGRKADGSDKRLGRYESQQAAMAVIIADFEISHGGGHVEH